MVLLGRNNSKYYASFPTKFSNLPPTNYSGDKKKHYHYIYIYIEMNTINSHIYIFKKKKEIHEINILMRFRRPRRTQAVMEAYF